MSGPTRAWRGRSHGGGLGTAIVRGILRLGGRDLCYLFLAIPAGWFWLRDGAARRAVRQWWRMVRPELSIWRTALRVPAHFWWFGCGLVDRVVSVTRPRALRVDEHGLERLRAAQEHPLGCILLSAHLGSFELASRWLARGSARRLHLVLLDAEDPRVQEQLRRAMGERPYAVIDLADPTGASLAIIAALGEGGTVCMLGDRTAGSIETTLAVPFLGRPARFPTGPFIAAAVTGAVIVPTFCVRTGWARWSCEADEPWTVDLGPRNVRRERLRAVVGRWADRVAEQARRHPWSWNNYYDFWAD